MSSKPETTFTQSVHKHLPPGRKDPYWMKNNNLYTSGIFDVWYSGPARDLWVEYKFIELPKRASTLIDIGLSELQKDWGKDRMAEGRNLAVIIGCKDGGVILTGGMWNHSLTRDKFQSHLMSRKDIAQWIIGVTVSGAPFK